jgi:[ribosomal protein S5]-alanine N-acetyltransferase
MFPLKTERLVLRHFQFLDAEAMYRIFCDAEVMHFSNGVQTKGWVDNWVNIKVIYYYQTWGYGPYAVVENSSQEVIGYCGLSSFPDIDGQSETEIGYRLAKLAWGKGYATEAAQAVRDFALTTLHIKRLIALIDPANIASIHVAEKIGMHYEKDIMLEGYTHADHVYVITSG